ncbi:MAG: DUF935 domain-containing protein [Chitinophagales bacterium]|nr:DUF935 domain-containing protein [Chitinophagales bacterium]
MGFFQKIRQGIESRVLNRMGTEDILQHIPDAQILVEAESRRGVKSSSAISDRLIIDAKMLRAQNLKMYKNAVAAATDFEQPDWQLIHELYDNLLLDNHLRSLIDTRIAYVQQHPFKLIDDKDNENEDITWLLQRPWFEELEKMVLMSRFKGRTLIELYDINTDGELDSIVEIPQSHFNAKMGIITKEPGNTTGWNYKEGAFSKFYVQIGKDYDLGMLEQIAPIVLAKKLALGSWQDYIEKYGVPPLFITTDREDDSRLRQLYEAAVKFKSNAFMIGRGQEKFEVGSISSAGTAPFDELIERANSEMSKAILGGAGLTDEKAYVGSSEMQYKIAKDRFDSDKLLFKHIFNHHIKPRLVQLSPVYTPLEKYELEWDNTETLDMKGVIETIEKIGSIYEIDPEYVQQITGIPILGFKQMASPFGMGPQAFLRSNEKK